MTEYDPLGIVGQIVADKYRIEKLVGEGGFAVVYRAQHTIWNKPVAIKFFNGLSTAPMNQRDQFQQAFVQEGALLTELSSQTAGIVQARDIGTYTTPDGSWMPFMVLEWLEGSSLETVMERELRAKAPPWHIDEVVRLLGQAARALDVAHGRGIAHRDVKPANLFVLGDDARSPRALMKVLDFGVAKMVTDNTQLQAALAKTGTNVTSFTPQYGAPEQFSRNLGATGPWTDVFSLALVATELLTGRTALDGEDVVQLAVSASHPHQRPTPRSLGAALSDPVEAVFNKALAVKPTERYARALEFWEALEAASGVRSMSTTATQAAVSLSATARTELASSSAAADAVMRVTGAGPTTGSHSTVATEMRQPARSGPPWAAIAGGALLLVGGGVFLLKSQGGQPAAAPVASSNSMPALSAEPPPAPPPEPTCPDRMVKIPRGQFFQGSDAKDARENEKPSHQVALDAFCIDLYEVTAGEYKSCSDSGKCKRASTEVEWPGITPNDKKVYGELCTISDPAREKHPINCVTWEMANLFCKAEGKRLPTESEWEYATRGPDGRVYPWGDDAPTEKHLNACGAECVAWAKDHKVPLTPLYPGSDGFATTAPVGQYEAGRSRFGPYDVVGNVWEWVADWDGAYTAGEKQNPTGPESGDKKVIRGGAWNGSYASWLRPSFRYAQDPKATSHGIGFRCAKAL